ncbi:MAG: hypothetical protein PQJ46_13635 [Spirochaetales bacterium]|nr:hypothetical protein [Spirochaetales bacterium]
MTEDKISYIRCRTCGKYIEKNLSINGIYCSEACTNTFTRCPNCGKFFPANDEKLFNGFCSEDCSTLYNKEGIIIPSNKNKEN